MFHVCFNVVMVMGHSAFSHVVTIVVCQMLSNVLMMMDVTTVGMVFAMLFHVVLNMLMVMLDVAAMLHAMDMAVLFGMRVLNMVQLSLTVVFCTTTMERVTVMGNFIVMFHDRSLINRLFRHVSYPRAYLHPF